MCCHATFSSHFLDYCRCLCNRRGIKTNGCRLGNRCVRIIPE
ncbi:hypothetical protein BAA6_1328 [Bifidobacterium animalis]|nr:hypothetical protein BAA6_1328 [Bifidobacterium animalis]